MGGASDRDTGKFRVILVVPPLSNAGVALTSLAGAEHLGLAYLAAALRRHGYVTEIVNFDLPIYIGVLKGDPTAQDYSLSPSQCAQRIISLDPDMVGFTVTGPTLEIACEIARRVREKCPHAHITFGGHQATATAATLLEEEPVIDSVGMGECDASIVELARRVSRGRSPNGTAGFLLRNERESAGMGESVSNGSQAFPLDDLPFPARDDLEIIQSETGLPEARLSSSRGSNEHCTFCADATQHQFRPYRMRSPQNVVAEIELLRDRFGTRHVWLVDDNFLTSDSMSQDRACGIARLLVERRLLVTLRAYFRPDVFVNRSDLAPLLFRAGVVTGLIGVESASPRRRKYLGKRYSSSAARETIRQFEEVGMGLQLGFIFFDPLTSIEDMRQDANFLYEIEELYVIFNFVQNMDVYPGTVYRRILGRRGLSTATHPYKGGFRQYRFADERIEPLAVLSESCYTPDLMTIDHAIWRLKIFNLPKLRWMRAWNLVPRRMWREISGIEKETVQMCSELNERHYEFLVAAIDQTEDGYDELKHKGNMNRLLGSRRRAVDRLLELGERAKSLVKEVAF